MQRWVTGTVTALPQIVCVSLQTETEIKTKRRRYMKSQKERGRQSRLTFSVENFVSIERKAPAAVPARNIEGFGCHGCTLLFYAGIVCRLKAFSEFGLNLNLCDYLATESAVGCSFFPLLICHYGCSCAFPSRYIFFNLVMEKI
jgi:hypothetical protein